MGAWGLGLYLSHNSIIETDPDLWGTICAVSAITVVLLFVVNIVGSRILTKKLSGMKAR